MTNDLSPFLAFLYEKRYLAKAAPGHGTLIVYVPEEFKGMTVKANQYVTAVVSLEEITLAIFQNLPVDPYKISLPGVKETRLTGVNEYEFVEVFFMDIDE